MISAINWLALGEANPAEAKATVFRLLQEASIAIQTEDRETPELLELVPRLAELLEQRPELDDLIDPFSALARAVGLWNYIPASDSDFREQVLVEVMSQGAELEYVTLHREQARALSTIMGGRNLILSAPTSFGKTLLIDAAIASGSFKRIAIVVPTIALLDETRRRLTKRFGGKFDVLMHHSEATTGENCIFLGTQERLINRSDLGQLDLLVVDEFYKLDLRRRDQRSPILNAAVYQLIRRAKQFLFLGPNVERVAHESARWPFEFIRSRFSTVAVDTVDLSETENKFAALREELYRSANWPGLVFVSSPDRANELAIRLTKTSPIVGRGKHMSEWLRDNFAERWDFVDAVAHGIGVHHGRVPRAVAAKFVQMFNDGDLPILICTSTLIEGVNTVAKSIFIYDQSIARRKCDFFTFSNIRGRAGRLGKHHVGRVYLFEAPPDTTQTDVAAPLFDDFDDAPDDFVIHLEEEDASDTIHARVNSISEHLGLNQDELKRFASIGVDDLAKVKAAVKKELAAGSDLEWFHWPRWNNLLACCRVICSVRPARFFGAKSHRQLALYLHRLRISVTMLAFFQRYSEGYRGREQDLDRIFQFLRACEYRLPEFFAAIELFIRKSGYDANYGLALRELPRWFRPEPLKILEERGIPMQISERVHLSRDTAGTLGRRLLRMAQSKETALSDFERTWLLRLAIR